MALGLLETLPGGGSCACHAAEGLGVSARVFPQRFRYVRLPTRLSIFPTVETLNISHLYEFCSIESSAQRCALALSPLTAGAAHANPRWAWRPCRGE